MPEEFIRPPLPRRLSVDDSFDGIRATVGDFWRWGFNDLRLNIIRGSLAEFLVARALGVDERPKVEWENFDLETPGGIRVEVKASGYWQSWAQRGPSRIIFSGLMRRALLEDASYTETPQIRADVFVFCLQACRDPGQYDPLKVDQWQFWVMPADVLWKDPRGPFPRAWPRAGGLRLPEAGQPESAYRR